jgi:inorganic pyrophosphatase/exopolyphosphatase
LAESGDGTVHVVLGSPACDMDSMVSSVARAFYSHLSSRDPSSDVVVPVFGASRGDLHLRIVATKLFKECDVNLASVACSNDLDLDQLQEEDRLKLTLVDHTVLNEDQIHLVSSVVEVIDHFEDVGVRMYDDNVGKLVLPVASCATLVADEFLSHNRKALEDNSDLVKLLLGVILLDTDNLSAITGLATDKDHDVVAELANLTDTDSDVLFSGLVAAKLDTSLLSAYDLLYRDYKDAPPSMRGLRAGGSSVPESAGSFLDRQDAISSLQQFYTERSIDVLLVSYVFYRDPEHQQSQRQIILYCYDEKLLHKVATCLVAEAILELKEVVQSNPNIRLFEQGNTAMSRQKLLHLISTALSQEDLPSFKSFVDEISSVQTTVDTLQSGDATVHVVLGSSACDLDSMVSSLSRAYYNYVIGKGSESNMVVPMFSASRKDLTLRTDATKLFEECNVNTANVTCAGDLDLHQLCKDGQLRLTLVDHSVLSEDQSDLVPSVVEIVDHHRDDSSGVYDMSVEKNISVVGSCVTLIADDFLTYKREALEQNPDLVKLLLGVILLDTDNLSPTTGLVTEKDHDMVAELSNLTDVDCGSLFDDLLAAKFDTSGLSEYDLLRRDYMDAPPSAKDWRAGGSTVPGNAEIILAHTDTKAALHQIVAERNLDVYVIICIYYLDSARQLPQHQIIMYCPNNKLQTRVVKCLLEEEMLGWKEISEDDPTVRVFHQENTAVSRKQLLLLISTALSQPDEDEVPLFKSFIDQKASINAVKELVEKGEGNLNVVIGSQHCDLDSMVSALALSYFNYLVGHGQSGLICPVFNALRTDLPIRADAMCLFDICNVNPDHVTCSGEINFNSLQSDGRLRLTLVNHNVPCESQRSLIPSVVEIVDHHSDNSGSFYGPDVAKRLEVVGSCATLIAFDFLNQKPKALEKNVDLVKLLLGTILLDTENLAASLATDKDWEVVNALVDLSDMDRNSLYRQLRATGYENAYNLLKGNYKDAPVARSDIRAGGSTVMMSLETFLGQKYAKEAVAEFAAEKNVDVFVVEFISYSDPEKKTRRRQLVIYSENHQLRGQVIDFFSSQPLLQLMSLPLDDPRISGFEQDDSVSRKQVLKMISAALMPTFKRFVDEDSSVEAAKRRAKSGKIHIVLGNESSDLDSMVSALARAYFTNLVNPSYGLPVPMFNINREDIPLRTEATWLLRDCDVNTVNVTCLGDLDLKGLQSADQLAVTLVDHNLPAVDQWELISSTVDIMDHHKDDTGDHYKKDVTKMIKPVGSCATLVAKDFLDQLPLALERNHDLVKLLLGAILVDTVNLDTSTGRTTDIDCDVVKQLKSITDIDRDHLYSQLQYAKFDLTGLSAYDLLCKDFKNAAPTSSGVKAGAASIPESFGDFLQRADSNDALTLFTEENGLDLLLLVSVSFSDPEYLHMKRQCGVYSENDALRLTVFNFMKIEESLKLTEIATSNPKLSAFDQGDTTASRKQLLPLLNAALSQYPMEASVETVKIQRTVEAEVPFSLPVKQEEHAAAAEASADALPELTAAEEREESRHWKTVTVAGIERVVDMEAIKPYKKVLSHGGYGGHEERYAVIIFAACHLPDKSIPNYAYVLDNLFYYCLGVLETQAADHFMVVYLHGGTPNRNVPKFRWMRRCYPMLDRRIKKNMKQLVIVHAGFWIRAAIKLMRPFISTKFYRKIRFIPTLEGLGQFVALEQIALPQPVLE